MASSAPEKEYNEALKLKEQGNEAFKKGEYQTALRHYSRICMWIGMNPCMNMSSMMGAPQNNASKDPLQEKTDKLRITAFLNIAQANVKLGRWDQVKDFCSRVLKHDENNEKALYRRGMAYRKEGLYELARKDYTKLKEILAENGKSDPGVDKEFKLLEKNEKKSDKEFMKQMKKSMQKAQKKAEKKANKRKEKEANVDGTADNTTTDGTSDNTTENANETTDNNNNENNVDETDNKNDLYIGNDENNNTETEQNGNAKNENENDSNDKTENNTE